MNEQEYFRRAAGTRIKQTQESQKSKQEQSLEEEPELLTEPTQEIEKPKRGRKKKIEESIIKKEIPVYEFDRDESGKPVTKNLKKEIKGLNEQNIEIENNAIDNIDHIIDLMIKEEYDKLSRCKVEIKITEKMYNLYNKDIYKTQLKNLKDRQLQCITRIRLLNELKEDE